MWCGLPTSIPTNWEKNTSQQSKHSLSHPSKNNVVVNDHDDLMSQHVPTGGIITPFPLHMMVCIKYSKLLLKFSSIFLPNSSFKVLITAKVRYRALEHPQLVLLSHLILPSQKATLLIISYHFTIHPASQNSIFFSSLLKNSFLLFFYYFFLSLFLFISLPRPLAQEQIRKKKKENN